MSPVLIWQIAGEWVWLTLGFIGVAYSWNNRKEAIKDKAYLIKSQTNGAVLTYANFVLRIETLFLWGQIGAVALGIVALASPDTGVFSWYGTAIRLFAITMEAALVWASYKNSRVRKTVLKYEAWDGTERRNNGGETEEKTSGS